MNNNNIFNNIETNNDFEEDELNSRVYNLSPMNPIDTKYVNSYHNLNDQNIFQNNNINNNNDIYYDEMKQNMLGIKSEYSMIKQNQSSMIDDESINSFGISKNIGNNNYLNNNKNTYFNTTTNNTSKNTNNKINSKKGNTNNVNNNKKINNKNTNSNINNNKVPKNNKKAPNNNIKNKK